MKPQEPKNFRDILELQKILDENIHSSRERTLNDILFSMAAEIVEFNEETKDSHKTWKTKPYDKEKELEELTDIFFFFAQLVNYEEGYSKHIENIFDGKHLSAWDWSCLTLLYDVISKPTSLFAKELMNITHKYGYTKDDILKTYWKKWQKNMERIGKEWN